MCRIINKEFIPCRKCRSNPLGGPKSGYYYDKIDNYMVIKECECHKKWRKEQELDREFVLSNVKADYSFDDYVGVDSLFDLECLKCIVNDPEKFKYKTMIYVYGLPGCQKTSMCQVLGKELIQKGYKVQYTLMYDLVNALVKEFDDPDKENKDYIIKRCMDSDFLIIDESFDKKKVKLYNSGYQLPYLDNFLRSRLDINKKSTIIISNVKPEAIALEGFGDSLQSFVVRNVQESTLEFKDNWNKNHSPDPHKVFKNND